jgi:hypothetical protein
MVWHHNENLYPNASLIKALALADRLARGFNSGLQQVFYLRYNESHFAFYRFVLPTSTERIINEKTVISI